jgi:hypothetical protein
MPRAPACTRHTRQAANQPRPTTRVGSGQSSDGSGKSADLQDQASAGRRGLDESQLRQRRVLVEQPSPVGQGPQGRGLGAGGLQARLRRADGAVTTSAVAMRRSCGRTTSRTATPSVAMPT